MNELVIYHLHTELSLLDSCTNYKLYVDKAVEYGQKAICFTEHGNIFSWVEKKMYCEKKGIKYLHGIEIYLTKTHEQKERDNFHTILIAKNYDGVKEINSLIEISSQEDHKYYNDRISFEEFFNLSDNIIKISACISSPLNKIDDNDDIFDRLINTYDYLEIQPHVDFQEQKDYNKKLEFWSKKYHIPLIAGTDTHSLDDYKSECRKILLTAKKKSYGDEETFDLTFKNYDQLLKMFRRQNSVSEHSYTTAINNTVIMADSVEDFELDIEFKYPKLYENEKEIFWDRIISMYNDKLSKNIISDNPKYMENIITEFEVFEKLDMLSFMLFMSELMCWCWENDIPSSPCRGSVGGSTIAYITDITDVDPIVWNTVFSRFANESRKEIGDIDCDFAPCDREKVYDYIVNRFKTEYTAFIMTTGTCAEKGTIDEICRALKVPLKDAEKIKSEYESNKEKTKEKYQNIFYYFDGLVNTVISKGVHPAAIIISPITLSNHYGVYNYEGKKVISINMEEVHEVSLVKYDILALKNIGVIKDCTKLANIPYPKSHEINWNDKNVWNDIPKSNVGIFQFESAYAGDCLKKFGVKKINDMSLVNAALRPSGASYRNDLFAKIINKNPSEIIDDMLKDNRGYLCYQEDTIKFLKDICGLSGGEADNVRRAIGRKDKERLDKSLPQILEGYCSKSDKKREISEQEVNVFLKIIEDSSNYQFGFNHSTGYSMLGYICAFMRFFYPIQFCTALLLNAKTESDIIDATDLANLLGIKINPPKFKFAKGEYFYDKKTNSIYKGVSSIKGFPKSLGDELYDLRNINFDTFLDFLIYVEENLSLSVKINDLILLQYFDCFGGNEKLSKIFDEFKNGKNKYTKKLTEKTKLKRIEELKKLENDLIDCNISITQQISIEQQLLGYIQACYPNVDKRLCVPIEIDEKYAPRIVLHNLKTGRSQTIKIYRKDFSNNRFEVGQIIYCEKFSNDPSKKLIDDKWVETGEMQWWLKKWTIVENIDL